MSKRIVTLGGRETVVTPLRPAMKKEQFLTLLWQRTRERGDFPALKRAMASIVATLQDELAGNAKLTATVLSDFTLTQKVLRLANSPTYAPYAQNVTTVSRALMILGSATVAYTAMNLQLLDTFEGLAATQTEAAAELAQAAFAGKLARVLATNSGESYGEEAAVAALLYQIARLLVVFYFPEEWARIRECLDLGLGEDESYLQVVGTTPDALREAAVQEWSLPNPVISKSASWPKNSNAIAKTHQDWLACLAGLSTELSVIFSRGDDDRVRELVDVYAVPIGQDPDELERLILELFAAERQPEFQDEPEMPPAAGKPINSEVRLGYALAEVNSAVGKADMTTITQMVLESMMHSLGLVACAAFFRISSKNRFEARLGFGTGVKENMNKMAFDGEFVPDVFHIALSQGRSMFLADIQDPKISPRIPGWHKKAFPDARSAVLLPIQLNDRSIGLLYGNWGAQPCGAGITPKEFEHLNAMRHVVSNAFEEAAKAPLGAFLLVDANKPPQKPKSATRSSTKPKS